MLSKLFNIISGWFKKDTKIIVKDDQSSTQNKPTPSPMPEPTTEPIPHKDTAQPSVKPFINFPDISHYEPCDFNKVEGFNDLITKATEGTSFIDGTLKKNMEGCQKKEIRFGVYHFYKVNSDPIAQAKFFIKTVGLDNLKSFYYPAIIDFETSKGQDEAAMKKAIPDAKKFIEYIFEQTGRWPIFYTYESLLNYLNLDESFTKCPLWIAKYSLNEPKKIAPWKTYWAWQYADGEIKNPKYNDNFPGIGRCDANIFKE